MKRMKKPIPLRELDPHAFVFMAHAAEVSGEGFFEVDASKTISEQNETE